MTPYVRLLRIPQWYKNLLVFLPIFFVGGLFNTALLTNTLIAFLGLCLISSANYILNDYMDIERDRLHPEKKHRPLAAGTIPVHQALLLSLALVITGLFLCYTLNDRTLYSAASLFLLSSAYTLFLKHILFADTLTIATNFVLRAVTGAYAIAVAISPWLILCTFLLALFLAIGKRHADLLLLKDNAKHHRATLEHYTPEITSSLLILSTTAFMISYSLYSLSQHEQLLMTIPFALYVLFRYFSFIYTGNTIARRPELIIQDTPILIGIALWVSVALGVLYL